MEQKIKEAVELIEMAKQILNENNIPPIETSLSITPEKILHTVHDNTKREISDPDLHDASSAIAVKIMENIFAYEIAGVQAAVAEETFIHTLRITGMVNGVEGRISVVVENSPIKIEEKFFNYDWVHTNIPRVNFADHLIEDAVFHFDTELLDLVREVAGPPTHSSTFDMENISGNHTFVGDVHAALAILINRQANLIAARTRRGAGNKVIVSPTALTILQSATTSAFARTTGHFEPTPTMSRCKQVGKLNNSIDVYCDIYAADNAPVTVLYKGNNSDAGVFFAPYAPFIVHAPTTENNIRKSKLSYKTHLCALENNAKYMGNAADYFGVVGIKTETLTFV